MRIKKGRRGIEEGDMTPMIDMVFQLIAFFMVLVNFTDAESAEDVVLPWSELAKPPTEPLDNVIFVHMTANAEVILGGERIPLDRVFDFLRREVVMINNNDNVTLDETTIIIRAHHNAKTGNVQKLIAECQRAGFTIFALRAKEGRDESL